MMGKDNKLILLLCLTASAGRFVLDCYLPSLPIIVKYFGSSDSLGQLTLTCYFFGFGITQFIYGPLSDIFGRRRIMLLGILILMISCILCTLSNSMIMLIISRFFAGFGAGAGSTLSRAIVADSFQEADIVKMWSRVTSSMMISLMIAPILGGYIQEIFGWRYNFLFSTIYVTIVLVVLYSFLPETISEKKSLSIKEIFGQYIYLLTHSEFMGYILCSTISFIGISIYFQLSSFIFIENIGWSPSKYGWLTLCLAISYLISGTFVNHFVKKLGIRLMMTIGISLLLVGGTLMLCFMLLGNVNLLTIFAPSILYFIGARIVIPNATAGGLSASKTTNGIAASLTGGTQMISCSVISYLVAQTPYTPHLTLACVFVMSGLLSFTISNTMITKKVESYYEV